MKQFLYTLVFALVGIFAMIEQSKPAPNRFIMIGAMTVFMFGLYRLMKKYPLKTKKKMIQKFEVGDKVAVLDDAISGVVTKVENNVISIKTTDDFVMTYFVSELVKINNSNDLSGFFSTQSLGSVLKDKEEPKKRSFVKEKRSRKDEFVLEVDLHIEKLVPSKRGMSNYDILTLQMDTAKRQLDFAVKNRMP